MENKLKKLFEYQKFEKNAKLDALIAGTHSRYGEALSDDDLEMVAAAGEIAECDKVVENDTPTEWYGIDHENSVPFEPGSHYSEKWFETQKE